MASSFRHHHYRQGLLSTSSSPLVNSPHALPELSTNNDSSTTSTSRTRRRIIFTGPASSSSTQQQQRHKKQQQHSTTEDENQYDECEEGMFESPPSDLLPSATLQERILAAKVSELTKALDKTIQEKESLSRSLRSAVKQNTELKTKLDSVSELLASAASENHQYERFFQQHRINPNTSFFMTQEDQQHQGNNNNNSSRRRTDAASSSLQSPADPSAFLQSVMSRSLLRTSDASTQAPDLPDAAAFDAEIERQTLYSSKDVRAALMGLLDRHEDVKDMLMRNSWLKRNEDFCQKFPSFVQPIRPVAIEMVNGKRPPTAETLMNANDTPRSLLQSELSELTRRAHPMTRHKTVSQTQKFKDEEKQKRTGFTTPNLPPTSPYSSSSARNNNRSTSSRRNSPTSRGASGNTNMFHFSPSSGSSRPNTANSVVSSSSPGTRPATRG